MRHRRPPALSGRRSAVLPRSVDTVLPLLVFRLSSRAFALAQPARPFSQRALHLSRLALLLTLPALLLSNLSLAAPPAPSARKTAVLLVPMDKGAEAHVLRVEGYMFEALQAFRSQTAISTQTLFRLPDNDEAVTALKRAEEGFRAGKQAYDGRAYKDAERLLAGALKEFSRAAAAIERCTTLCDAYALHATVLQLRKNVPAARERFLELLALRPNYELEPKQYPKETLRLRNEVAASHKAQLRSSLTVQTHPQGARVFVDGEEMGFSPVTLSALAVGPHLVRVERPGFTRHGQLVELTTEDATVTLSLDPTAEYRAWDTQMDRVGTEVKGGRGGPAIGALGKTLGLTRALVGTLRTFGSSGAVEVDLGVYELGTGKRLSGKRTAFQGEEYGELKSEMGRVVTYLLHASEGTVDKQPAKGSDPLDGRSGMEDWSGEQRELKGGTDKRRTGKGDPLDTRTGTEDW